MALGHYITLIQFFIRLLNKKTPFQTVWSSVVSGTFSFLL